MSKRRVRVLVVLAGVALAAMLWIVPAVLHTAEAGSVQLKLAARRFPAGSLTSRMSVLAARQRMMHPMWRDLTPEQALERMHLFASRFIHRLAQGTGTVDQPPLAPFLGNFTGINAMGSQALALQRQADCSLSLYTGTYTFSVSNPAISILNTTKNYERVLHSEAQLKTTANSFPKGCKDPTTGLSSQRATYLGKTTQNLHFFAASGYYAPSNGNALYYGTVDAATLQVKAFHFDTSEPTINAVTSGDLNGDGLADVVSVDGFGASASVGVRLAHPDGSLDPVVSYSITGSNAEAAVVDDFNGDGKLDVAVAISDGSNSNSTESIAILAGKGDGTLGAPQITQVPNPGQKIANLISVNLQGKGKDLVASNGVVLLNDGHGSFSVAGTNAFPALRGSSEFGPNLASGDVNADGQQDIVVNTGEQVLVYLGNGDGTFTPGNSYATINDVGYVTVTDLDGDGNADIYIGLAQGGFFGGDQFEVGNSYALMGNGDGTFVGAPVAPAIYNGFNLADLNGDKIPDMVAANGTTFVPELGNGDGTFKAGQILSVPSINDNGTTVTLPATQAYILADVNGDGAPDLIWTPSNVVDRSTQRGFYLVALNKGDGSFGTPAVNILPSTTAAPDFTSNDLATAIQTADLNHDGKQDLIFTFSDNDYQTQNFRQGFLILLGKGDGSFTTGTPILTYNSKASPTLSSATLAAIADVNGDNAPDLFVVNPLTETGTGTTTEWQLYLNKGDGTFNAPTTPTLGSNPLHGDQYEQTPIAIVDLNGDGHLDVASIGQDSTGQIGSLVISLGKGDGTFTPGSTTVLSNFAGAGFSEIAVADFNGDGKNDIAFPSINGGGIFLGNGDGTVQVYTDSSGATYPAQGIQLLMYGATTAADMNGDGLPDLLVGDTVLLNLGKNVPSTGGGAGSGTTSSLTTLIVSAASISTGADETLTAAVVVPAGSTALPTGSVHFLDGTTSLGTGTLDSKATATFSTTSLTAGSHSITAAYSGDAVYASSTSPVVTVTVTTAPPPAADFAISLSPGNGAASGTAAAKTTLTVTPTNGFSSAVSFACSGLPSGYSCSFSPQTVTPHSATATTAISFDSTQMAGLKDLRGTGGGIAISLAGVGLAGWLFAGVGKRRRWLLRTSLIVLVAGLAAGVSGISGCGGSSSNSAQTSSVTITAKAGSLSHSATYTLTTK
jgi:Bacterial Ig-like domain (group 3)/FG-GAP-like repeat